MRSLPPDRLKPRGQSACLRLSQPLRADQKRPVRNGRPMQRFNRTLATEWAYRQVFTTNDDRSAALPDFLDNYHHKRRRTALGGQPPSSRTSPTLTAGYS